jgi:hypothetical protein
MDRWMERSNWEINAGMEVVINGGRDQWRGMKGGRSGGRNDEREIQGEVNGRVEGFHLKVKGEEMKGEN